MHGDRWVCRDSGPKSFRVESFADVLISFVKTDDQSIRTSGSTTCASSEVFCHSYRSSCDTRHIGETVNQNKMYRIYSNKRPPSKILLLKIV